MSSIFNIAVRSAIWKMFLISPFWVSWTSITLLKNHVLKIFLDFFNFLHLKNMIVWTHTFGNCKLFENMSSCLDSLFIVFLLFMILYLNFLFLNFMKRSPFSWGVDMLQDHQDWHHFLSRIVLRKPILLTAWYL